MSIKAFTNFKNKSVIFFITTCFILLSFNFSPAATLSYSDIPGIASYFFYTHVNQREFSEELYLRTVKNFVKILDPTKIFLLAGDVESFEQEAREGVKKFMADFKSGDMSFFVKIHNFFNKRLAERKIEIDALITEDFKPLPASETDGLDSPEAQLCKTTAELELRIKKILSLQYEGLKSAKKDVKEIVKKLKTRYKEAYAHYDKFDEVKIADYILKSFATALDPHSLYFNPEEIESFNISFKLSLEGIGATLKSEDGYTIVDSLVTGGPAEKSRRIKPNDKIIAVGQQNGDMLDIIGMDLNKVVQKIRGPKGTKVRLSILREPKSKPAEQFLITIVRDKIKLVDQAVKRELTEIDGKKYGVIKVPSFYEDMEGVRKHQEGAASCSSDVKRAMQYFNTTGEVEGIVLDLRSDTGGSLNEAVKMAGLFIKRGVVVMVKDSYNNVQELADQDAERHYNGPIIVLVNKLSASASEIVAGALKDYGIAVVAGDSSTYGKGSVQTMINLPNDLGAIKVTNALYYTAGGASTQKKGVPVDIVIPSATEEFKSGEATADYALDWSVISSAIPRVALSEDITVKSGTLETIIKDLADKSRLRVEASPKFKELAEKNKKNGNGLSDDEEEKKGEKEDTRETIIKKDDIVLEEAFNILKDIKALTK